MLNQIPLENGIPFRFSLNSSRSNIERRNMSRGQRAIIMARIYRQATARPGKAGSEGREALLMGAGLVMSPWFHSALRLANETSDVERAVQIEEARDGRSGRIKLIIEYRGGRNRRPLSDHIVRQ
jgi:hypothetical protein